MPVPLERKDLESRATKIIDALYGYGHRQEWMVKDRLFIADLLQQWDEQVTKLLQERSALTQRVYELESLNAKNEWLLAGRGGFHYIKFLLGVAKCPSR